VLFVLVASSLGGSASIFKQCLPQAALILLKHSDDLHKQKSKKKHQIRFVNLADVYFAFSLPTIEFAIGTSGPSHMVDVVPLLCRQI
jgi:hypothetical protein